MASSSFMELDTVTLLLDSKTESTIKAIVKANVYMKIDGIDQNMSGEMITFGVWNHHITYVLYEREVGDFTVGDDSHPDIFKLKWTMRQTFIDPPFVWLQQNEQRTILDVMNQTIFTMLVVGPSGCGKTTFCKELASRVNGYVVHQDSFYINPKKMETVRLEDQQGFIGMRPNWDTESSISWKELNQEAANLCDNYSMLIIEGSMIKPEFLYHPIDLIVVLHYTPSDNCTTGSIAVATNCKYAISNRLASKKWATEEKKRIDEAMVRRVVIPKWETTFAYYVKSHFFNPITFFSVYNEDGKRRSVEELLDLLERTI